jgi:hypothetical protein
MHMRRIRRQLARWVRRYLPAEAVGLVVAVLAGLAAQAFYATVVVVVIAAWAETAAYYATMLARDVRAGRQHAAAARGAYGLHDWLRTLRNLMLEFGIAEVLDSLLLRPALMYVATQLTASLAGGIVLGKLGADLVFYVPTIIGYELRQRYLPDPERGPRST